jgi:hypothetical protein
VYAAGFLTLTPMSSSLTIDQIIATEVVPYDSLRDTLQTGDLVFCSGTYFFSNAIRWFTKSCWSHIGMIYRDDALDRILILESETFIGVRFAPLSKYLRDYHGKNRPYRGRMFIARLTPEVPLASHQKAISFGMDELTKPYDNWEIFRIAMRILFKVGRRNRDQKYICSELIYEAYRKAGVLFHFKHRSISPDDIWQDARVMPVGRIL